MAEGAAAGQGSWRVLVVDDNPTNAKLLQAVLVAEGHQVAVITNADEVVASAYATAPDVVLMDIQMPGKDGLTLTREMRADPVTRDIAIVAVTAFALPADRERALSAGCDEYVAKPIDTRALPGLIDSVVTARSAANGERAVTETLS